MITDDGELIFAPVHLTASLPLVKMSGTNPAGLLSAKLNFRIRWVRQPCDRRVPRIQQLLSALSQRGVKTPSHRPITQPQRLMFQEQL